MTGGQQIFVKEILGVAYDSQAEHFLRGDVGVDAAASARGNYDRERKSAHVLWTVPSSAPCSVKLHLPGRARKMVADFRILRGSNRLFAFAGLVTTALRSSPLSSRARNWMGNACVIGFALGSPLLLLLGNLSIYDEAIIWGFGLVPRHSVFRRVDAQTTEGAALLTWSLLAFSFCAGAALLSRATFGAPFLLIGPLLAHPHLPRDSQCATLPRCFLPLGASVCFLSVSELMRDSATLAGCPCVISINPDATGIRGKPRTFSARTCALQFRGLFRFCAVRKVQREASVLKSETGQHYRPSHSLCDAFH